MVFNSIKVISIRSLSHAVVLEGSCVVGRYSSHCALFVWCRAVGQNRGLLSVRINVQVFMVFNSIKVISIRSLGHTVVLVGSCGVGHYSCHCAGFVLVLCGRIEYGISSKSTYLHQLHKSYIYWVSRSYRCTGRVLCGRALQLSLCCVCLVLCGWPKQGSIVCPQSVLHKNYIRSLSHRRTSISPTLVGLRQICICKSIPK